MPFTIVQAAPTVQAASLTTATVTLPQPTGAGNTLVACVTTNGNAANPAVSGLTLGGSADNWKAAATGPGTTVFGAAIWYDPNCAAGQTSVVVTCTGGSGANPKIYIAVYEVAGVLAADQAAHADRSSNGTTWTSGATPATTQASEIFFGACMGTPTAIPTVTGAGTWITQGNSTSAFGQVSGDQAVSTTGTATFSGTMPSGGYSAIVATFAAAPPAVQNATSAPVVAAVDTSLATVTGPVHGSLVSAAATSTSSVSDG